jgi:hypothetical protein
VYDRVTSHAAARRPHSEEDYMRLRYLLAIVLLAAAVGCGRRTGTTGTTRDAGGVDVGIKIYPGAKPQASAGPGSGPNAPATSIATYVTKDSVDQVDEFYRKALGRKAERTDTRGPQGGSVNYSLKRGADERISVGIIRNSKTGETVFMISRSTVKR